MRPIDKITMEMIYEIVNPNEMVIFGIIGNINHICIKISLRVPKMKILSQVIKRMIVGFNGISIIMNSSHPNLKFLKMK
jgi:hypothetical protein